jgi:hypothetical protein
MDYVGEPEDSCTTVAIVYYDILHILIGLIGLIAQAVRTDTGLSSILFHHSLKALKVDEKWLLR